ncbi:MAG: MarR family transcriptional regulator [Rhodobiaceae bacterium]|nr:MAG: MarR family transcriptional regulator [Rhodobiaceae bacterium]
MSASNERIYFLLQMAAHRLRKKADNVLLDQAGLTTAQVAVLNLIAKGTEVNQRELAERLHQNESAMTAMVQRLLKANLITRHRSKKDGRNWVLEMTDNGRTTLDRAHIPFKEINTRLDRAISSKDTKKLAAQLNEIIDAFSDNR